MKAMVYVESMHKRLLRLQTSRHACFYLSAIAIMLVSFCVPGEEDRQYILIEQSYTLYLMRNWIVYHGVTWHFEKDNKLILFRCWWNCMDTIIQCLTKLTKITDYSSLEQRAFFTYSRPDAHIFLTN